MISPLCRIAFDIQKRRLALRLSQRQLAKLVGCDQSYIAHIEATRKPVSRRLAESLERVLKVKPGRFTRADFPRGRPPLLEEAKKALRQTLKAEAVAIRPGLPAERPEYPRPDILSPLENRFWPMAIHLGPEAAECVLRLEALRPGDERFWRPFNSFRLDPWSEKLLTVKVALTGAQLLGLSAARIGCELVCADGMTGKANQRKRYPTLMLQVGETSICWIPQRCVQTSKGCRWADNLLVLTRAGRKKTAIVEVDGAPYHKDLKAQRKRDALLGVPVMHLDAAEVIRDDVIDKVLAWAVGLVA